MDYTRSSKRRQLDGGGYSEVTITVESVPASISSSSLTTNLQPSNSAIAKSNVYQKKSSPWDDLFNQGLPTPTDVSKSNVTDMQEWEPLDQQPCSDNEYVCFGMISVPGLRYLDTSPPKLRCLPVVLLGNTIALDEHERQPTIAVAELVEERAIQVLTVLQESDDVDLQLYCQLSRRMDSNDQGKLQISCELRVILYGRYLIFERIGSFMSQCDIYLQDPINCDRDVVYMNPHSSSSRLPDIVRTTAFSTVAKIEDISSPADIFDQFSTIQVLREASQPRGIKTMLHSHQRQGLAFLLQKEQGWALNSRTKDMWSLDGNFGYINNITGEKRSIEPPQLRGGIVADQMGLGKRLLMIGLVATDLEGHQYENNSLYPGVLSLPTTLIVVPFALIQTWTYQLDLHVDRSRLKWNVFLGQNRTRNIASLGQFDIVLTTYDTVIAEINRHSSGQASIHDIVWRRIILDEAHIIRNHTSLRAQAIHHLQAERRWAVSGTPIQNHLTDLASLVKFLKIDPFDDIGTFEREFVQPWRQNHDLQAVVKLKQLLNFITLRRSKQILNLPVRTDQIRKVYFTRPEREVYELARFQTQKLLLELTDSVPDPLLKILPDISKMRMLCNHQDQKQFSIEGSFQSKSTRLARDSPDVRAAYLDLVGYEQDDGYPNEKELLRSIERAGPSMSIHSSDMEDMYLQTDSEMEDVSQGESPVFSPILSSKISAILDDVSSACFYGEKVVVYSFWITTLQAISLALDSVEIRYVYYTERIKDRERQQSIDIFNSDPTVTVILATFSAASVGLNLTVATQVLLVEPQWNPMTEEQALSRIHRMGQKKPVKTIRYVVRDTIEESVIVLHQRNADLASLALAEGKLELGSMQGMTSLDALRKFIK